MLHRRYLLALAGLTLAGQPPGTASAQEAQWAPAERQVAQIFAQPFLKASLNTIADGQVLPPFKTVDFDTCTKPLVDSQGMTFGIYEEDVEAFKAAHPEVATATGDVRIVPHEGGFVAFFENRFWGSPPTALFMDEIAALRNPDGSALLRMTSRHALEMENKTFAVIPQDEQTSYALMIVEPEDDGKTYLRLDIPVDGTGAHTKETKVLFSCLRE